MEGKFTTLQGGSDGVVRELQQLSALLAGKLEAGSERR
jgi:hypothetical protein